VRCRASRGADTFVFTALNGGPLRPRNVTKAWSRIRKRLGLPNVPLQGLRHTQVSTLLRAGVDVFTVSRRIGHSQATTTLNRYAHLIEGADREAAKALEGLLK
jgi:integrase